MRQNRYLSPFLFLICKIGNWKTIPSTRKFSTGENYEHLVLLKMYPIVLKIEHRVGGSLNIKMADGGIQRRTFIVKYNGTIDFSITRKTALQELRFFHVWILTP